VVPPLVKLGKPRALAVTTPQRSPIFPGRPAIAETVPGFSFATVNGLMAPAKTPEPIIRRLNQESVRFIRSAETKDKLADAATDPVGNSPQEFAAYIASDIPTWSNLIKKAHIRPDE
jgi:tripartite-type tricarboxylate transporter receptor subunit TctC